MVLSVEIIAFHPPGSRELTNPVVINYRSDRTNKNVSTIERKKWNIVDGDLNTIYWISAI